MNHANTEISLTVHIGGELATRGRYELKTKMADNGKPATQIGRNSQGQLEKTEVTRLHTLQLPRYHKCQVNTTLGGQFCAFAVSDEARPKKTIGAPYWNRLSAKNRLELGVARYVSDLYGDVEYSFQIMGE